MFLTIDGEASPLLGIPINFERRRTMNVGRFEEVWNEFLAFMDRVVQWLVYLFQGADEGEEWPPVDYPDINM